MIAHKKQLREDAGKATGWKACITIPAPSPKLLQGLDFIKP